MIDSPPDIEKIDNNNGPCATDSDCPSNLECINHGCVKKNQNIGRDYEEVLDPKAIGFLAGPIEKFGFKNYCARWWSSGQRSCLLLRRAEFESH